MLTTPSLSPVLACPDASSHPSRSPPASQSIRLSVFKPSLPSVPLLLGHATAPGDSHQSTDSCCSSPIMIARFSWIQRSSITKIHTKCISRRNALCVYRMMPVVRCRHRASRLTSLVCSREASTPPFLRSAFNCFVFLY